MLNCCFSFKSKSLFFLKNVVGKGLQTPIWQSKVKKIQLNPSPKKPFLKKCYAPIWKVLFFKHENPDQTETHSKLFLAWMAK